MSTALKSPPKFTINKGASRKAHRTLIYGVGGIGKSSLAASIPGAVFIDLEGGAIDFDVKSVNGVESWQDLRALLASDALDDAKAIVLDTASRAEELARNWVVANVKTAKGNTVSNLQGYGYGEGGAHLTDAWRLLLADLDRHYRAGRDIVLIAHEHLGTKPNPSGEDYKRHEPRLYHDNKSSVRAVTVEWCDHVLFINYDVMVSNDGKAKGSGSRAIYTSEQATFIAKSRTLPPDPIIFTRNDASIWNSMRNPKTSSANEAPEL